MDRIERAAYASRWRDRHPAEKVLAGGSLLVLSLALPPWPGAFLVFAAAAVAALGAARVSPGDYAALLAAPAGFLVAGAGVLAVSVHLDGSGPVITASTAGLAAAGAASLRAMAATASLLLIVLTTPVTELLALIRRAGLPAPLVDIMLLTYRFGGLALQSAGGVRRAQANRLGYDGFGRSIRSVGMLAANLLPRTLDRAVRMELGLAARAYDGELRALPPRRAVSKPFVLAVLAMDSVVIAAAVVLARTVPAPW